MSWVVTHFFKSSWDVLFHPGNDTSIGRKENEDTNAPLPRKFQKQEQRCVPSRMEAGEEKES